MESKQETSTPLKKRLIDAMAVTKSNLSKSRFDIETIVWPADVMNVVLAFKAVNRSKKQLPFHYQVIEYREEENGEMLPEKNEGLMALARFLEENMSKLPPGLRFQLAVLLDGHWTAVDHVVTSKGLSCFNLDAVMDQRALRFFRNYLVLLDKAKVLQASYMYYVSVPQAPLGPTPIEKVENMIQTDFVSCGIFMADHLSFLSRTNVFHHLKAIMGEPLFKTLGRSDVSPALAPIFRLTQSKHLLRKLSARQIEAPVSREGTAKIKTLKDVKEQARNEGIKYNVIARGNKLLDEAAKYLVSKEKNEIERMLAYNLISVLVPFVDNYSPVVNQLIGLIYNKLSDCNGLNDEAIIKLMAEIHQIAMQQENEINKLLAINSLLFKKLQSGDVNTYRLMAASISLTLFHLHDNKALWAFYQEVVHHSVNDGLHQNTNSFFNKPTKLTPALSTYVEKAVKVQLLLNALEGLSHSSHVQLDSLAGEMAIFLNKSRTFDVKTTQSAALLQDIILAKDSQDRLSEIAWQLKGNKNEILEAFGLASEGLPPEKPLKM